MPGIPTLFLLASLGGAWFTWNVYRPMVGGSRRGFVSFFAGWLTGELALHHVAWQAVATVAFVALGALAAWPGWVALAIDFVSWCALVAWYLRARDARHVVEDALASALGAAYRDELRAESTDLLPTALRWRQLALPFPMRDAAVERIRDLPYARAGERHLRLDLYRPRERSARPPKMPVLLQVHGGGWAVGSKNEQGMPLMLQLASHGWLCASIDYRLSPRATFPDHVVDVKQGIAWLREHASEYGGDPDFIVITGGSAGGHLASLAALSPNDPDFQPGFESKDTTVQGCVSFYGVYDFTNKNGVYRNAGLRRLLERWVMKARLDDARERYERASPLYRVSADAPPFFVIHGDRDTLVPVGDARHFVEALRAVSREPVLYAELPGAQHAFEIFPSLRSQHVIDGVERYLFWLRDRRLGRAEAVPPAVAIAAAAGGS
ncbi:MAG TPA: alpha/beta hydrolase [Candidatus Binatia bacterium]|nr:alpha/beta hydrolase [Candidatus Binatia bacterium]